VLSELKAHYGISFLYAPRNVEGKYVEGVLKFTPRAEEVLDQVLAPLHLKYKKIKKNTYAISQEEAKYRQETSHPTPGGRSASPASDTENAFSVSITGRVTDDKNEGIPGVNVLLKGTTTGTTTDGDGRYPCRCPMLQVPLFSSFIGYVTEEVSIATVPPWILT
jgi:hypothetical protein